MNRCVIIGSAKIQNYQKIKKYLKKSDYFVFCDGGLNHQQKLGVDPDLIIGDFDSFNNQSAYNAPIIKLPCEKDDTDTFAAAKEMLNKNFDEFLMIGVTGQRLDHTLGNISILIMLQKAGKDAKIIDDLSEISIIENDPVFIKKNTCRYFSVLCCNEFIDGVTIEGAKYPLKNAKVCNNYQYAISNEVTSDFAKIQIKEGKAILIKIF